jgi:signal transduction histidine kinase
MLLHSRERTGERRSTDLNALVGESLNLAYHGARAGNASFSITLKHDLDPDAGALELYPQEITRALLNIISNGFYAATRRKAENGAGAFEPVLSAATRNFGETVEIRIRDNGTGIPPARIMLPIVIAKQAVENGGVTVDENPLDPGKNQCLVVVICRRHRGTLAAVRCSQ